MFDDITDSVKAFVSEALVPFAVAAFVGDILIQLGQSQAIAIERVIQIIVTAVVVGLLVSVVIGALRAATK